MSGAMKQMAAVASGGGADLDAYGTEVSADSPVGWWRLKDDVGSSTAIDSSGNGLDMSMTGDVTFGQTPSADGMGGAAFDGNDYLSRADNALLKPAAMTYEFWMKTTEHASMAAYGKDSRGPWNKIGVDGGAGSQVQFTLTTSSGGTVDFLAGSSLRDGNWHHIVGAYEDGSGMQIHIDGTLVDSNSKSGSISWGTQSPRIGIRGGTNDDDFWRGDLAEVAVYDFVLSPARIAAHYSAGIAA